MEGILNKAQEEQRAFEETEQTRFDEIEKEINAIDKTIEAKERARNLGNPKKEGKEKGDTLTVEERAFVDYIRGMKIYGADTVEGYTRPSFFVYITQTFSESTKNAFYKNVEVEIDFIQKNTNEAEGMAFFAAMEEMFGQKLIIGRRSLNTSNMDLNFQGENANIPVCQFDVEFWDAIPRTDSSKDSSKLMEELKISQEVKQGDYQ